MGEPKKKNDGRLTGIFFTHIIDSAVICSLLSVKAYFSRYVARYVSSLCSNYLTLIKESPFLTVLLYF